ncbi:RNA 2',3'-cyclic phosphodiesterase [Patescibacteria group bacterium]|nr:RNA 2',3'-cyclic phosphodiesterase [Patescibacteria group bacterium]
MSRIFIAINLSENIKEELGIFQKEIQDLFPSELNEIEIDEIATENIAQSRGVVRWVKKENLHLTLVFIGHIKKNQFFQIAQIIKKVVQSQKPLFLKFEKICYGPAKIEPPRLIWMELEKEKELLKLVGNLQKELFAAGILGKDDKREFSPHITLARINAWLWRQIEPEERPEIEKDIFLNFPIKSIEIMESKLKKGGPVYTILESYLLSND